jgi:hypothetical protein
MIELGYLKLRYRLKTLAWLCALAGHRQLNAGGHCGRCDRYVGTDYFMERNFLRRANRRSW